MNPANAGLPHKDLFGVEGKTVLLNFGLLSANKEIETMISALPAIVERHPRSCTSSLGQHTRTSSSTKEKPIRSMLDWLEQNSD